MRLRWGPMVNVLNAIKFNTQQMSKLHTGRRQKCFHMACTESHAVM